MKVSILVFDRESFELSAQLVGQIDFPSHHTSDFSHELGDLFKLSFPFFLFLCYTFFYVDVRRRDIDLRK